MYFFYSLLIRIRTRTRTRSRIRPCPNNKQTAPLFPQPAYMKSNFITSTYMARYHAPTHACRTLQFMFQFMLPIFCLMLLG